MKKIVIAGGSGFLGKALTDFFSKKGEDVKVLARKPTEAHHIFWDGKHLGEWEEVLEGIDVLINLCGKSVDCRYTEANRQAILDSRIMTTQLLQRAINRRITAPKLWINASSATIYIHSETQLNTDASGVIGDDFSMNICKQWEQAFFEGEDVNLRKVALRTSIVLGSGGGAFPKLKLLAQLGMGGRQGRGTQKISWIHIADFCSAVDFIIEQQTIDGAINITAPEPISNQVFMSKLRKRFGVAFGINQPRVLLELGAWLVGTETELLLKSRNVYPQQLLEHNFQFEYPTVEQCLNGL